MPSYGWIDIAGRCIDVFTGARELAESIPGIDLVFCSVEDWIRDGGKGARREMRILPDWRRVFVAPDAYCPRGMIHGIDAPPKVPIDVGSTWA